MKRQQDRKQHIVDAAFKLLDKFGYISILKDFVNLYHAIENDESAVNDADNIILQSVFNNMQLKHLQDSENENDKKFLSMIQEVDGMLNENVSDLFKMSFIAGLMAISSLLPANALTKTLTKA